MKGRFSTSHREPQQQMGAVIELYPAWCQHGLYILFTSQQEWGFTLEACVFFKLIYVFMSQYGTAGHFPWYQLKQLAIRRKSQPARTYACSDLVKLNNKKKHYKQQKVIFTVPELWIKSLCLHWKGHIRKCHK